ncbi:(R)-mandelonitrile lyase [Magnetofaba australis]
MHTLRNGAQAAIQGPEQWFTGHARIDPLFLKADAPSRLTAANVTFEPGARTAWHAHPLGQTLIVTAGRGRVQQWGEPVQEIHPGDVVRIPPNSKHWHGASDVTAMTHIALQEELDEEAASWMEHVTDAQFAATP